MLTEPVTETARLEDRLVAALRAIREHWAALLEIAGTGSSDRPSTDAVSSLDKRISMRHEVTLCLNGWARIIVEDRDLSHGLPLGHDTLGLVGLLERHARWFSGHEACPDATAEIEEWAGRVRAVAAPEQRTTIYLGDCPFVHEQRSCTGRVVTGVDDQSDAWCQECGQTSVVEWWRDVLGVVDTVVQADIPMMVALTVGRIVSERTVQRWMRSSGLEPVGRNARGRNVYDRAAVMRVAEAVAA